MPVLLLFFPSCNCRLAGRGGKGERESFWAQLWMEVTMLQIPLSQNARGEENVLPRWKIRTTTKRDKVWDGLRVVQVPAMPVRWEWRRAT